MIKHLQKVGTEGIYLDIINAIFEKSTTNIILNGEKLKAFPLRSGTRQGCSLLPRLLKKSIRSTVLEALATAIKQKRKRIPTGKEEEKLSIFEEDMILYIQNSKHATKKPIRTHQ